MIDAILIVVLVIAALALVLILVARTLRKERPLTALPEAYRQILQAHVPFYQNLNEADKKLFDSRAKYFLDEVRITDHWGFMSMKDMQEMMSHGAPKK